MSFDAIQFLEDLVQGNADVESTICDRESTTQWVSEYEERAAILEYEGGLEREAAEDQAREEVRVRLRTVEQSGGDQHDQ
jgi:hypothetical protein